MDLWPNEKIIRIFKHHPAVILPHLILCFAIVILDFFLMYWLILQGTWGLVLFFAVLFSVAFYLARLFFLFRRNRVLVTNKRLIVEVAPSLFEQSVNDFSYPRVSQAKAIRSGLGATLFRYGDLQIFTAAVESPYVVYKISEPLRLQNMVNERLALEAEKPAVAQPSADFLPEQTVDFENALNLAKNLNKDEQRRLVEELSE